MSDTTLLLDVVRALSPHAEDVWRALGYDPDSPGWTANEVPPLEIHRLECEALLARLRAAVAGADPSLLERLAAPPGPLCLGCDELEDAEGWDHDGCEAEGRERMAMWERRP